MWPDIQPTISRIAERLDVIEQQLEVLSNAAGVPYARPVAAVPPEIVELARAGKTLDAIREYRALTNADHETAKTIVMGL
jgi:hypothetical protein